MNLMFLSKRKDGPLRLILIQESNKLQLMSYKILFRPTYYLRTASKFLNSKTKQRLSQYPIDRKYLQYLNSTNFSLRNQLIAPTYLPLKSSMRNSRTYLMSQKLYKRDTLKRNLS